jgi:hypothetical protein
MDFFAITSPDILDGTGSAVTITACVNAPQAGAVRKFYPLVNTILTHGATFDIVGNASLTAAAGDCWEIEAKTTSTYRVAVEKEDGSPIGSSFATGIGIGGAAAPTGGIAFPATQVAVADANTLDDYEEGTFTGTLTGCTTSPTYSFRYVKVGGMVTIRINAASGRVEGTSNATTKTITGMPSTLWPSLYVYGVAYGVDNGGTMVPQFLYISPSDGSINMGKDLAGNVFTASGSFISYPSMISYPI